MKDSEFIELLNLYLDSEISPSEASRLEAEVQRDPQRYQIYLQYCRMQKACTLLAADFSTDTPSVVALKSASRRRAVPSFFAVAGAMAAAACVAFVFLNRTSSPVPTTSPQPEQNFAAKPAPAPMETQVAVTTERTIPQTVTVPERRPEFKPVLVTKKLGATDASDSEALQDPRLNWLSNANLPSMTQFQAETLRFDSRPSLKPTLRNFAPGSEQPPEQQVTFTFQR